MRDLSKRQAGKASSTACRPGSTKRQKRRTKAEINEIETAVYEFAKAQGPVSVQSPDQFRKSKPSAGIAVTLTVSPSA